MRVKYKVKSFCGLYEKNSLIDAFVLYEDVDTNNALIYLPRTSKENCGCLVMCNKENGSDFYIELSEDSYINLDSENSNLEIIKLLGKR